MKVFEKRVGRDALEINVLGEVEVSLSSIAYDKEIWMTLSYAEWDNLVAAVAKAREATK